MPGLEQVLASNETDLRRLGARFGLDPEQTRSALGSLTPAVLSGGSNALDQILAHMR